MKTVMPYHVRRARTAEIPLALNCDGTKTLAVQALARDLDRNVGWVVTRRADVIWATGKGNQA